MICGRELRGSTRKVDKEADGFGRDWVGYGSGMGGEVLVILVRFSLSHWVTKGLRTYPPHFILFTWRSWAWATVF